MKLMRNDPKRYGICKYALIRMDKLDLTEDQLRRLTQEELANVLVERIDLNELIELGAPGSENEFFVVKLKDTHARATLLAYADHINKADPEFSSEVKALSLRAGPNHPNPKEPD